MKAKESYEGQATTPLKLRGAMRLRINGLRGTRFNPSYTAALKQQISLGGNIIFHNFVHRHKGEVGCGADFPGAGAKGGLMQNWMEAAGEDARAE